MTARWYTQSGDGRNNATVQWATSYAPTGKCNSSKDSLGQLMRVLGLDFCLRPKCFRDVDSWQDQGLKDVSEIQDWQLCKKLVKKLCSLIQCKWYKLTQTGLGTIGGNMIG